MKYAKVIPLGRMLNMKIPSKWFRRTIGGLEILCGIALTFIPNSMSKFIPTLHSMNSKTIKISCYFRTYQAGSKPHFAIVDDWSYLPTLDG